MNLLKGANRIRKSRQRTSFSSSESSLSATESLRLPDPPRLNRVSSQSFRKSYDLITSSAREKKEFLDQQIEMIISGRQALALLNDLEKARAKYISERSELLAERERVVQAVANETGIDDPSVPQYMDDRIELIDAEVTVLDAKIRGLQDELGQIGLQPNTDDGMLTESESDGLEDSSHKGITSDITQDSRFEIAIDMLRSMDLYEIIRVSELLLEELIHFKVNERARLLRISELDQKNMELSETLHILRRTAVNASAEYEKKLMETKQLVDHVAMENPKRNEIISNHENTALQKENEEKEPQEKEIEKESHSHTSLSHTAELFNAIYSSGVLHRPAPPVGAFPMLDSILQDAPEMKFIRNKDNDNNDDDDENNISVFQRKNDSIFKIDVGIQVDLIPISSSLSKPATLTSSKMINSTGKIASSRLSNNTPSTDITSISEEDIGSSRPQLSNSPTRPGRLSPPSIHKKRSNVNSSFGFGTPSSSSSFSSMSSMSSTSSTAPTTLFTPIRTSPSPSPSASSSISLLSHQNQSYNGHNTITNTTNALTHTTTPTPTLTPNTTPTNNTTTNNGKDVFERLAHSHTMSSQAKVNSYKMKDRDDDENSNTPSISHQSTLSKYE